MSRRVSLLLLKNYTTKFHHIPTFNGISHDLSKSFPNVATHRQSSSVVPETIQVSKHIQPLLNQPVTQTLSNVGKGTTATESVALLKLLRMHTMFKGCDASSFKDDSQFKDLCFIFQTNCGNLPPRLLVSGLRSLLEVGVPSTDNCIITAEKNVIRNIYQFNILNLIGCLYFHHKFTKTKLQQDVNLTLVNAIQSRIHEIMSPAEVLMLMHVYHLFGGDNKKHLELQIIKVIPLFQSQELRKLFCVMGEKSIRNVFILNVAAFHLRNKMAKFDFKEVIDLLYVFKKLNFYEPSLYGQLLNNLSSEIPSVKQASLISGLLTVCGHMRWKNTGLLDACSKWIQENFESCKTREFVSYVLTSAALSYCTQDTKNTLDLILPHLTIDNIKSPSVLLDITWSLAILDSVPKNMLLNVLSTEFYKRLDTESGSGATDSNKLKLLNLKGVLRNMYPENVFRCDLYLDSVKLSESSAIESCRQHVLKVLSNFVPKDTCLCTNQVSDTGIFIDAEMIMDINMKPLSLKMYGSLANPEGTLKDLPKDAKRIALLILFSKDITHHNYSLTGLNTLALRLLKNAGYTVVLITYEKYSENKTELQKTKYLSDKIKSALQKN